MFSQPSMTVISSAKCRGLIEAGAEISFCQLYDRRFPRRNAEASLKLQVSRLFAELERRFPRRNAEASLKHDAFSLPVAKRWAISSAKCRGLIEAKGRYARVAVVE